MNYNNNELGVKSTEAYYEYFIKVISSDEKVKLYLNFNNEQFDFKNMELNNRTNIINYLYWDTSIEVDGSYYLFDLTKEEIFITRTGDNKYRLEVNINNPNMIYTPIEDKTFDSLKVDTEFSFVFDYKPEIDSKILEALKEKVKDTKVLDELNKINY